jgi:hypothetical protein
MTSPQARPTPPQREPLTYFGDWCGQGWSAGREGQSALVPADLRKPAIVILNRQGVRRASPVDQACKLHDIAYDAMAREPDGYKAAQIKLAADRALLARVGKLLATDQRGQGDLNMGEVLYARNVQIAFRTMLFFDGVAVARNLDIPLNSAVSGAARKAGGAAMRAVRAGAPYALVLMAGPQTIVPAVMRLALPDGG